LNGIELNSESSESISSVEITKTSKGINLKVKCYNVNIDEAKIKSIEVYKRLVKEFHGDDLK